ncbi:MAG: glutathione S-transferase family protein [Proteobacteria bacterium]|nr:glutathione S-transferase family protein [Pseudomonadota bacterium]
MEKTMLTLYDFPESGNSWKIRQIIKTLDIPCKIVPLDGLSGESHSEEFKKKNVDERLPALELPDGTVLAESGAILWYLAKGSELSSDDPLEETEILRWMFFEQNRIVATIAVVRFCILYLVEEKRDKSFEDVLRKRGAGALKVMNSHLKNNDYFAANRFTIADIALYAYSHVAGEAGLELSHFPNILRWIKRVEERERFIPFTER